MAEEIYSSLKGFDQYEIVLGDQLRGERATLGKSLLDVQRDLKIKASYIAAIENCDLEVFSNQGFIAGYVRSYARYLGLDPEVVYEQFCSESSFSNVNNVLSLQTRKPEKILQKKFGKESGWRPGKIGQLDHNKSNYLDIFSKLAPVLIVVLVLCGSIWGGISVLKQVQRLDIVAFDDVPEVSTEPVTSLSNSTLLELSSDIYSSEELAIPVLEPRDAALSTLKPDLLTALSDKFQTSSVTFPSIKILSDSTNKNNLHGAGFLNFGLPDPVLRTAPEIPSVKILAMTPAWIRVKNQIGDVIFEKILDQRETYLIKKELFKGELRAGNAQNVYFIINEKVHGPLSNNKSVVKNVSLDPKAIESDFIFSKAATEFYRGKNNHGPRVDTAGVSN